MIRRTLDRHLPKGRFGRGVAVLAGGSIVSQALAVLSLPLITRLYSPEDLGVFGVAWSLVTLLSVAACLRYEYAIPTAADARSAAVVLLLSALVAVPVSVVAMALLALGIEWGLPSTELLPVWVPAVLFPLMLALGLGSAVRFWMVREQHYSAISSMVLRQGVARLLVTLGAGAIGWGWPGLIAGELAGRLAGIARPLIEALRTLRGSARSALMRDVRTSARVNARAPRILLPSALLDTMGSALLVPIVMQQYGAAPAGLVLLVQRVLSVPTALVGTGVADVFHGTISAQARSEPERIREAFTRTMSRLALLGAVTVLPLAAASPWIFPLAFGDEWSDAGWLTAAMGPWAFAALVVSPVSRLLIVLGRERWKLYYDVLAFVGLLVGLLGGAWFGLGFLQSILLTSLLQTAAYVAFIALMRRAIASPGLVAGDVADAAAIDAIERGG